MSDSEQSDDAVAPARATPAILRTLRPERPDDCGAFSEEDVARGRAGAHLALRLHSDDDSDSDAATVDCDTKRVSFHERLVQVRMISPRGSHRSDSSGDESDASDVKPTTSAAKTQKVNNSKLRPVKSASLQRRKDSVTSQRRVKSATERTSVKHCASTSSSSTTELLKKLRRTRSAHLQQRKHAMTLRRPMSAGAARDVDPALDDLSSSSFTSLLLESDCRGPADQMKSARRVYAWHVANGTAPPDNMAPSVANLWDHQQTRVSQLFI